MRARGPSRRSQTRLGNNERAARDLVLVARLVAAVGSYYINTSGEVVTLGGGLERVFVEGRANAEPRRLHPDGAVRCLVQIGRLVHRGRLLRRRFGVGDPGGGLERVHLEHRADTRPGRRHRERAVRRVVLVGRCLHGSRLLRECVARDGHIGRSVERHYLEDPGKCGSDRCNDERAFGGLVPDQSLVLCCRLLA